jgi:hypothetical protein
MDDDCIATLPTAAFTHLVHVLIKYIYSTPTENSIIGVCDLV